MQPQALVRAHVRDRIERIDRAGIDVAGGRDHADRMEAGGAIGVDLRGERRDVHLERASTGTVTIASLPDSEHRRGLGDRHVRHRGRVDARLAGQRGDAVLVQIDVGAGAKRDGQAGEVRERAAAQQHADALRVEATISFIHSITWCSMVVAAGADRQEVTF